MRVGAFTALDGVCVPYRFPHRPCETCVPTCNNRPPGNYGGWDAYENVVAMGHMRYVIAEQRALISQLRQGIVDRDRLDSLNKTS